MESEIQIVDKTPNHPGIELKIRVIHYLLILCLALLPFGGTYAANADHDDLMSESCGGCDKHKSAGHDSCEGEICMPVAGHCGSGCSLSALTAFGVEHYPLTAGVTGLAAFESRYCSCLVFSIYRPPIA
jgi:hypothetical protein